MAAQLLAELLAKLTEAESQAPECDMDSSNLSVLCAFTEQLHTVERRSWARETNTDLSCRCGMTTSGYRTLGCVKQPSWSYVLSCPPDLQCKDTRLRVALSVEKCVAISVWKPAIPDCYRSVANQFGVGKSTVGAVLLQVCRAINPILRWRTMALGNVHEIVDGFAEIGFPNCGRVINGAHIPILVPDHLASEYINRKGYFSVVLQALVNHRGRFTDISADWSRKVHDACIFRNSGLYRKLQAETFFPDHKITVGDVEMPIVIVGDPAYPLQPWLMKSYTGHLDSSKERFNNRLSRCCMVVKCAFGHLKARWRCLNGRLDLTEDNIPVVVAVCCTFCIICVTLRVKCLLRCGALRQSAWCTV
ncbi:uncharacterized protein RBU57_004347 [Macrochelys suwanniensis]